MRSLSNSAANRWAAMNVRFTGSEKSGSVALAGGSGAVQSVPGIAQPLPVVRHTDLCQTLVACRGQQVLNAELRIAATLRELQGADHELARTLAEILHGRLFARWVGSSRCREKVASEGQSTRPVHGCHVACGLHVATWCCGWPTTCSLQVLALTVGMV